MYNEIDNFSLNKKLTKEEKARARMTYNILRNSVLASKGIDIDTLDYDSAMCAIVEELASLTKCLSDYDIMYRRGEI